MMDTKWFALRVPYCRELKLKELMDNACIRSFLPMQYIQKDTQKKILVPVVHNLLFVHSTQKSIESVKANCQFTLPFHYLIDKGCHKPIVVPDRQMENFIAVAGTFDDRILFLKAIHSRLGKGDKVRITGGIFKGVEGEIMRIRGDRRVVVTIKGFMGVATAFIHPTLLESID